MKFIVNYSKEWSDLPAREATTISADRMLIADGSGSVEFRKGNAVIAIVPLRNISHIVSEDDSKPEGVVQFRLAEEVLIDHDALTIHIDGEPFPYYLAEGGPLVYQQDGLAVVSIPVIAETVEQIGRGVTDPALDSTEEALANREPWTKPLPPTSGTGANLGEALTNYEENRRARALDDADEAERAEQILEVNPDPTKFNTAITIDSPVSPVSDAINADRAARRSIRDRS